MKVLKIIALLCAVSSIVYAEDPLLIPLSSYKYGYLTQEGELIAEVNSYSKPYINGFAVSKTGGDTVVLDADGQIVCTGAASFCEYAAEGIVPYESNRKFGYKTFSGEDITGAKFDKASDFRDGRALVFYRPQNGEGFYAVIDKTGKPVFKPAESPSSSELRTGGMLPAFHNGILRLKGAEYDIDGGRRETAKINPGDITADAVPLEEIYGFQAVGPVSILAPDVYKFTVSFRTEKSYNARSQFRCGLISSEGRIISKAYYDQIRPYSEDRAAVRADGKWGYIDNRGKLIIACAYDEARDFQEGRAAVRIGSSWTYIDAAGTQIGEPRFEKAFSFSCGLALVLVKTDELWGDSCFGYINRSGEMEIPASFQDARPFLQGLAAVYDGEVAGYINTEGRMVWSWPRYKYIFEPNSEL